MGQSDANCTVLPASSALLTSLMRSGSSTVQFWCFAHSSTANTPFASVAVVITGTAPHTAASARARSLAPPGGLRGWARQSGRTRPAPQRQVLCLALAVGRNGPHRNATAPTKTRASLPANWRAVQSARCTCPASWPQRVTLRDMPPPVFGPVQAGLRSKQGRPGSLVCPLAELGGKGRVVELAALIVPAQKAACHNERRFGDARCMNAFRQRTYGAANRFFFRPCGLYTTAAGYPAYRHRLPEAPAVLCPQGRWIGK